MEAVSLDPPVIKEYSVFDQRGEPSRSRVLFPFKLLKILLVSSLETRPMEQLSLGGCMATSLQSTPPSHQYVTLVSQGPSLMSQSLIIPNSSWTFGPTYAGTEQYDAFRTALTDFLAPSEVNSQSFEGFWNSTGRFDTNKGSSSAYMNGVYGNLISYYQWTQFGQPWYEDYAAQNDGRLPFVSPSPLVRWQYGANNVSEELFQDGLARKEYYQEFITGDVLVADNATCSNAIYAEPANTGSTSYRASDLMVGT